MPCESILIVEDNAINVKLARLLLAKEGYEVRSAGDSVEAFEALLSFRPSLILMDIQLPGMDGLELTRRLKQGPETKDAIIIALTAYAMKGDEEKARAAGCDGYITKPIDTRTFVEQIRQYLGKTAPTPTPRAQSGDPNDLLRELRNGFIAEGEESSRRIADADPSGFDLDALRRVVHHWIGIGGTLGFPQVTASARELEEVLNTQPVAWQQRVAGGFAGMRRLFEAAGNAGGETPLPTELFADLSGKQVGIVGFGANEAARVRAAFGQVHAVARDLAALSDGLGMEAMRSYDLIVLNACTEGGVRSWGSVLAQPVFRKPLLLVSSRTVLMDAERELMDRAVDFVLAPWDAEELLFRAQLALKRNSAVRPAQAAQSTRKSVVVIADDDAVIHALLTPMLTKLGIDSLSAHDGREALDMVKSLNPDALVLDISMPRISGISVLTEIRKVQRNRTMPILMLTARRQTTDVSMAMAFGATDYATKPFDPEDVIVRIQRLLSERAIKALATV